MLGWRGGSPTQFQGGKAGCWCGGRVGPLGGEKWMGAGGCQSFGELFHLRLYNPAVPPTERGSRAGPHDPPPAGGGTAQAACSSSWSFCFPRPPPPACFPDTFFFFFSQNWRKKTKRARTAACSGACSASKRQSSPTFPLPPQLRAPQTSALLEPKFACRSTPL